MRTLAVLSAILLLAAPDLAQAQERRARDRDDRVAAASFQDRGRGGENRGRGRGRGNDDDRRAERRGPARDDVREAVREGRRVSLREVLPQIQRRTPGRILDSFPETGPGGQPRYRVRWQSNDGQRIDYIVDARTGAIIGRE